jgi:hypothetical protein
VQANLFPRCLFSGKAGVILEKLETPEGLVGLLHRLQDQTRRLTDENSKLNEALHGMSLGLQPDFMQILKDRDILHEKKLQLLQETQDAKANLDKIKVASYIEPFFSHH